ncbi:phospholipase D-like domain-containing protein [Methylocapsa palsarum]|uniref:phospholipase D n=1 Tax=Methylocapsa palsarum TaxID=1612308 RepID=A0A1I3W6D0_9HYPH|nr:phospholipase D-like domain-containing protein [Methylocapsa palsarum]SFK02980.1 PLD-like domain-containing protein [Methylocapsa palsarum]
MTGIRTLTGAVFILASLAPGLVAVSAPCGGDPPPAVHFAPAENLERIDVSLVDQAKATIDMAAYVMTDWPVMQALTRAAGRGVKVRIYLDSGRFLKREPTRPFVDLISNPGVEIRFKRPHAPLMHLKSYEIDGRLLRTGSANFSASGLKRQDNDLVVIENPAAILEFEHKFETIYGLSQAVSAGAQQR